MRLFHAKRLFSVVFFLFFLFAILIVQFYHIQIVQKDKWLNQALLQHRLLIKEPFMRGKIFVRSANSWQPLSFDVVKYHLFIDPERLPVFCKKEVMKKICSFFSLERKKIEKEFYKKSRSRRIIKWVDVKKKEKVLMWWDAYRKEKNIPGNSIYFLRDYKRVHPFGSLLGQVLHTTQEERGKEGQAIPTGGIEHYFQRYLSGRVGYSKVIRSPRNYLNKKIVRKAENGSDIYLTIDQYIQAIVEEELKKGVQKIGAKGGWALMMEPSSGEILAIAQYPFFNLEKCSSYFNDPKMVEHTEIKPVSYAFEPGSIFKPINLAIFLQANRDCRKMGTSPLFFPMEKIKTSEGIFPGRKKPIKDARVHKFLNMYMAIQKSSNVYMSELMKRCMNRLKEEYYINALEKYFGFGKKMRVELPGQAMGMVPKIGKKHRNGTFQWSSSTPYSLATGHNILVNSIQILRAYAIFANRGWDVQPTIVKKIMHRKDMMQLERKKSRRIFFEEDMQEIINAMKFTTKIGGTARFADVMGYTECGKTGTSEKIIGGRYSDKYYISSFIGFTPVENPKFVLMVVIDEPKKKYVKGMGKSWNGGVCAAPIFRKISQRTLKYLGTAPDDVFGYPSGDPRSNRSKADWALEVKDLNRLYHLWNN